MSESLIITCPKCNHSFDAEKVISNQVEAKLKFENESFIKKIEQDYKAKEDKLREYQEKLLKQKDEQDKALASKLEEALKVEKAKLSESLAKKIEVENQEKMALLEQQNQQKMKELKELKQKEIDFMKQTAMLNDRLLEASKEKELAILTQKKEWQEKQLLLEAEAIKKAEEQSMYKTKELEKQLEDQKKLIQEMQRKAEQGSMQLQGEVMELALEELLKNTFPHDLIGEVAKGIRGADVTQTVRNNQQQACGVIIYESKRTKSFSEAWIEKLKNDLRAQQADIAILVTEVLPKGYDHFGLKDGIWVCTFQEVKGLAMMMRESLIKIHEIRAAQTNRGEKMQMLYDYLTQKEFRSQLEAIVEGFTSMQKSLEQEKRATLKMWKEREKQIEKVMINTTEMYGSIRGIAGKSIADIKALEADDYLLESENDV
jgi:hypothetical protein